VTEAFVEIAVTLPVPGRYHYRVPPSLLARARVGARVLVRFGPRKVTGVIVRTGTPPPAGVTALDLSEILDEEPALPPELVDLCLWISEYYEAPPGEVLRGALPAGSGVGARVVIGLTAAGRAATEGLGAALPAKQRAVLATLAAGDVAAAGMRDGVRGVVDALITAGLAERRDRREASRVRLRRERVARLAIPVEAAREQVRRAPKRLAVVEALAAGELGLDDLATQLPGARPAIRELERAGVVIVDERERAIVAVPTGDDMPAGAVAVLTAEQEVAVAAITAALASGAVNDGVNDAPITAAAPAPFQPFLLHGVTGSGKTEVYLRVIARSLAAGRTAIVLVPEISLTPQLAARFRARFGDLVAILHSGMSEQARLGEWSRLRRGDARIAVGARSAVFAPLTDVGVIVIDEEHDGSFKQDEGVRYHARDVAVVRAQRAGAVCVLGSATPSLESYAHAQRGAYRLLTLTERPTARPMPTVEIIDLRTHLPDPDSFLSATLRAAIAATLAVGDQTILFLNRRGFATFVLCRACGHAFRCPHCSVSLTYHRHSDRLSCHYCGYGQRVPEICPSCKSVGKIERKGLGTEKVADALAVAFPGARIARLDRDVATGAKIEAVLAKVARREVDLLVGTQMVTKGHDFPGVTLVGVLCADTGLNLPDFRASERTFQLLAQVAGRAGRGDRPGKVVIQTYRPGEPAVVAAAAHDYGQFYAAEVVSRAELGYPPHGRLIAVRIDGPDGAEVARTAHRLAQLATTLAERPEIGGTVEVRGPVPAPLERLRNRTRWQIWLRGADRVGLRKVARGLFAAEVASAVRVGLDVDPLSAL
jgi:primosomal protein N' (replication factor Y)